MESRDRALAEYPELQNKESLARKHFDEYVRQAQQDPDYASVFKSPKWPELMVREFVSIVNANAEVAQAGQPQPPPQQSPAMGTQAKVLTTGTTTQPANAHVTGQQVVENMSQLTNEQIYSLLGNDDRQPLR
jgi:acyl-CoA synthetase (AMP-forming)/AMP-acid ligase II